MQVAVNDLSFQYKMYSREEFIGAMTQFIQLCKEIESTKCTKVRRIIREPINADVEILSGESFRSYISGMKDRNNRTYLLGLLVNRGTGNQESTPVFTYDGKTSYICARVKEGAVVSLLSNCVMEVPLLRGEISGQTVDIINISKQEHIDDVYKNELGVRVYRANSVKHKKYKENYYGGGKVASIMDLDDELAQEVLNRAIIHNGRLYGKYEGKYYAFQNEQDNIYHGYVDTQLGEDIRNAVDRELI